MSDLFVLRQSSFQGASETFSQATATPLSPGFSHAPPCPPQIPLGILKSYFFTVQIKSASVYSLTSAQKALDPLQCLVEKLESTMMPSLLSLHI